MNGRQAEFEIRPFEGHEDWRACVALQEEVWGSEFSERVPAAVLMIAGRIGGVASGAYTGSGELVGFVFGLTGVEGGRLVHWSDMLAVRAAWRGRGLGTALKLHQRDRLLELGVRRAYWTFDPLELRNAALNLGRLGAIAREYAEAMYGPPTSPLHRGIGTDRLVITWEIASDRVRRRLDGSDPPPPASDLADVPSAFSVTESEQGPVPVDEGGAPPEDATRIVIPAPIDIQRLKQEAPELAVRWRKATRRAFATRLKRGWEVREVVLDGNRPGYLLVRKRKEISSSESSSDEGASI